MGVARFVTYGVLYWYGAEYVGAGPAGIDGPPWQEHEKYVRNSPIFHLDEIETPLLLVHGERDTCVPRQQSEEMYTGLERLGKEVCYVLYRDEGHSPDTWRPENVTDHWRRTIEWSDRHLK